VEEMKEAVVRSIPNYSNGSKGPDVTFYVDLYKDKDLFGMVDAKGHSRHYAEDIAENWENGILGDDNEYIQKS
jgi:hypothetical protein